MIKVFRKLAYVIILKWLLIIGMLCAIMINIVFFPSTFFITFYFYIVGCLFVGYLAVYQIIKLVLILSGKIKDEDSVLEWIKRG